MRLLFLPIISLALLVSTHAFADTLQLLDDQKLKGNVIALDSKVLQFELGGQTLNIERTKVKSIVFDSQIAQVPVISTIDSPLISENKSTIIPNGTKMMVKLMSNIDSSKHNIGYKFTTRLETDIVVNGVIAAPRGTVVYGVIRESKQSNRIAGSSNIELQFTDMRINNVLIPLQTSLLKATGESTTKTTISRTARFAAVGGLANGSKGAENAAKAGLGVSLLTSGNTIKIPRGTLVEFTLTAPVNV